MPNSQDFSKSFRNDLLEQESFKTRPPINDLASFGKYLYFNRECRKIPTDLISKLCRLLWFGLYTFVWRKTCDKKMGVPLFVHL